MQDLRALGEAPDCVRQPTTWQAGPAIINTEIGQRAGFCGH